MASTRVSCVFVVVLFLNLSAYVSPRILVKDAPEVYPFDFFSRYDWGAEVATNKRALNLPVPYVVIHHTYLPAACFTLKQCAADMRSMQKYHIGMGWGDIGYNFCVGSEGGAFEGRGWDYIGVHAGPANNHSIGICLIGDYRVQLPTPVQLSTVKGLIKAGVMLGKIQENYKLIGHRQAMSTECPGDALLAEIATWENYEYGTPDFNALNPPPQAETEKLEAED